MKDRIVEQVVDKYQERSKVGIEKYGTTLEGNTDGILVFLNHLQEELMDATLYIEKLKGQVEAVSELINKNQKIEEEWHNWEDTKKDGDPIRINWSEIPDIYQYVAMDENGLWCAFMHEPKICTYRKNRWYREGSQFDYRGIGYHKNTVYISYLGDINWKETLRKRP